MTKKELLRTMGLTSAVLYGLGTIIGAGIYVLVGNVAQYAGMGTPASFLLAALLAVFSVLSYAEISGRFPHSAGAAEYVFQGFGKVWLTRALGAVVLFSGIASAGALTNGFVRYMQTFLPDVSSGLMIFLLLFSLCAIAAIGIRMSTVFVLFTTCLSIAGLLFILFVSRGFFGDLPERIGEFVPDLTSFATYNGLFLGAFLAFYAFIGFEDLVHTAEEMKNPRKNLPRAIILTMIFASILYLAVTVVNLLGVSLSDLTAEGADPSLVLLYRAATGSQSALFISAVGIFSILNSVMVQILMTSRLLYGMSKEGWLPKIVSYVHPKTQTPLIATGFIFCLLIFFSLVFDITKLANLTTFFILTLFTMVNLSLVSIKRKQRGVEYDGFRVHWIIPVFGAATNIFFLVFKLSSMIVGA